MAVRPTRHVASTPYGTCLIDERDDEARKELESLGPGVPSVVNLTGSFPTPSAHLRADKIKDPETVSLLNSFDEAVEAHKPSHDATLLLQSARFRREAESGIQNGNPRGHGLFREINSTE